MGETELEDRILASLNEKQRQAVTSPSSGILQIVAGPGTGKTKVIVSRVAYLLLHEQISPQNIIVTTFTKKAANEMMERLRELFAGTEIAVGKLLIGTFHSICYKIIQKYGKLVKLENVSIADEKDAMQILTHVLTSRITDQQWDIIDSLPKDQTLQFKARNETSKYRGFDEKKLRRHISKAKSLGLFPETYDAQRDKNSLLSIVYQAYQNELISNRVLDFDDCLLYCYKIVSTFPVLEFVQHTLVDEFQDTNEIQLQLMYHFAKGHRADPELQHNVTIVGDPDQSIYAFRDAQAVNFEKMRLHYAKVPGRNCEVITLDENYRSTSDILHISETVMRQQSDRVVKNLTSQHSKSFKPVQAVLESNEEEAKWIAHQIECLQGLPQDIFTLSDMAILVRSAYQTRAIETELTKRKIPYFMVRGKAFWDRKEVVAMLDYLRCVANENDKLAFMRCVNFPKRGLGPKTLADLESVIDRERISHPQQSVYETLKKVGDAELKSALGPKMRSGLKLFLLVVEDTVLELETRFDPESNDQQAVLEGIFSTLYKNAGISREFEDSKDCDLNICEVKSQLMAFEPPPEDLLPGLTQTAVAEKMTGPVFVRKFLELISLYDTDPGKSEEELQKPKVSISTIHGSKGLEWPVVFVPGLSEGLLPASFAINEKVPETINEERRCFYVATSRAQALLFISGYVESDYGLGWHRRIDEVSRFMKEARAHCVSSLDISTPEKLLALYEIRGMSMNDPDFSVKTYMKKYNRRMKEYVKREEKRDLLKGFTFAGDLDLFKPENLFHRKSVAFPKFAPKPADIERLELSTSMPEIICIDDESDNSPKKAPSVTLPPIKGIKAGFKKPAEALTGASGVKRAPAYIPVRPNSKKRLGTK
ncbi:hypothetical protein HF325_003863 [Metschnikowia pulcherrima]|uniref:DNA 3'-5' helicase n=1 Tax=Metschnikowia pulcherrima TaxID=27326 RepID=A0A8H7LDS9_9ASCO|nr:hypothetical protein HF325_003863 [Metschnikowia pulcherrima]